MADDNAQLASPVMTALEVARYLRICGEDGSPGDRQSAIRSVHRLVQTGQLRPLRPGREYVFWRAEVDSYIQRATDGFNSPKSTDS